MADPTPNTDTGLSGGSNPGMPPWVKLSLIIVGVLVVVFIVLNLTGWGGNHGPGRHIGPGGGAQTPSSSVTEHKIPAHGR
jgi:hypothetical protein